MLISVRSVECGVRSRPTDVGARVLNLSFRTPHSALRICLLLAACTPITTRPAFRPDPRDDPWVPGQTRLTTEPVYRPRYDPSRAERDLEVMASKEDEGYKIAQRLVDKLKQKFGVPKAAQEEGRPTPPPSPSPTPP